MKPVDEYFYNQKEPYQSIMLYIRDVILRTLPDITERYSYKIPFYNIGKKPMLYLNILKGKDYVDVAFVQGVLFEDQFPSLKNDNNRKQVRSLQVKSLEEFNEHEFRAILLEAKRYIEMSDKPWFV
ncbi:DUF1801 domain-containing protein [Winogradskyella sp. 3972H.M.0a.05]|uniref:DUF1801 domain-containing protein n=1 Tax=Winogradskyella sp. 3972H.M.0a.05 TaxID=2950277 RepID=UPI00339962D8